VLHFLSAISKQPIILLTIWIDETLILFSHWPGTGKKSTCQRSFGLHIPILSGLGTRAMLTSTSVFKKGGFYITAMKHSQCWSNDNNVRTISFLWTLLTNAASQKKAAWRFKHNHTAQHLQGLSIICSGLVLHRGQSRGVAWYSRLAWHCWLEPCRTDTFCSWVGHRWREHLTIRCGSSWKCSELSWNIVNRNVMSWN